MTKLIPRTEIPFPVSGNPVISIAGAGGKTTLMFELAKRIPGPVVMTTTTKVGAGQIQNADICLELQEFPPRELSGRMWVSPSLEPHNGKITGCSPEEFSDLAEKCRKKGIAIVNEADGAARRHIKAPAGHEPVIPGESDICIYVVGLDVLGLPLNEENVHRPDLFSSITGLLSGEMITPESIVRLLEHPQGGLKNIPVRAVKIVCMTHADSPEQKKIAEIIASKLKSYDYASF